MSQIPTLPRTLPLPLLVPLLLSMLCPLASAQTAAETFAKAKRTEIQNASARQALPLYELVAQSQKATDTLKARALYRLSICYLKLEEYKKASDTLTRLETSYPRSDQAVQARLLRKTLGASEKVLEPRRDIEFEVQQILVDGTLGNKYNEQKASARAALTRLDFLGESAVPILRKALTNSSSTIRQLAMATLAQRGDEGIFAGLVAQAKFASFSTYRSAPLTRSPKQHLVRLCGRNPGLLPRLKQAYVDSDGDTKARLLTVFMALRRLDLVPDYQEFLDSGNPLSRITAWEAFTGSRDRKDPAACREYLKRLLDLWAKHTAYRTSLAQVLVQAHALARTAGEPMATRWETVLVQASKDDVPGLAQLLSANYQHTEDLRLPLRHALLASPTIKYAELAMNYRLHGSRAEREEDVRLLVDLAFRQSLDWIPRDPKHAVMVLGRGARWSSNLSFEDWRHFMDRLLEKETLAKFLAVQDRDDPYWLRSLFLYTFANQNSPEWYERRLPSLLRYGSPAAPPVLLPGLLSGITVRLTQGEGVSPDEMAKIKELVFRVQDGKPEQGRFQGGIQQEVSRILNTLVELPGGLTLEETVTRFDFSQANEEPNFIPLIKRTRLNGGLVQLIESMATNPEIPIYNLLRCVELSGLENGDMSAASQSLWSRSTSGQQARILRFLPRSKENAAFIDKHFDTRVDASIGHAYLTWIREYEGVEQVPLLMRVLQLKNTRNLVAGCKILESLADPRSAPGLIELLTYPDTGVRVAAEKALESIRNIDKNQKAWRDWYEGLKKKG